MTILFEIQSTVWVNSCRERKSKNYGRWFHATIFIGIKVLIYENVMFSLDEKSLFENIHKNHGQRAGCERVLEKSVLDRCPYLQVHVVESNRPGDFAE
ncbi:hypothetical protein LMG33818_000834 [Halomonadaceae bacterium LMG 33818]